MCPDSVICVSNGARPEVRRLRPASAAAACAAPGASGTRWPRGRGPRLLSLPAQDPGAFQQVLEFAEVLVRIYILLSGVPERRDGSALVAQAIQPPAEGVAGAHELSCVGWKVEGTA